MTNAAIFTQEEQLPHLQKTLNSFWQQGKFSHFTGKDNITIHYAAFSQPSHQKCLLISPGRSESYLKFKELAYDFYKQGFDIFIIDHRGQGLSQRMLDNPHKGYVKNFDDYAADLHYFIKHIVIPHCQLNNNKPLYVLAHSMGGAITVRYLQNYTNQVKAVVLSSPMIDFNKGGIPNSVSRAVIKTIDTVNHWFGTPSWYFFGQDDYQRAEFSGNPLTHSVLRFQQFMDLYQAEPQIQLGGATVHWLAQALNNTDNIFANIDKIKTPTLVIQSGNDTIVDNQAQRKFCQLLHQHHQASCPNGEPVVIQGAAHELFIEQDKYREAALSTALNWFNQHP